MTVTDKIHEMLKEINFTLGSESTANSYEGEITDQFYSTSWWIILNGFKSSSYNPDFFF